MTYSLALRQNQSTNLTSTQVDDNFLYLEGLIATQSGAPQTLQEVLNTGNTFSGIIKAVDPDYALIVNTPDDNTFSGLFISNGNSGLVSQGVIGTSSISVANGSTSSFGINLQCQDNNTSTNFNMGTQSIQMTAYPFSESVANTSVTLDAISFNVNVIIEPEGFNIPLISVSGGTSQFQNNNNIHFITPTLALDFYQNTRSDGTTASNFLATDSNGNVQSISGGVTGTFAIGLAAVDIINGIITRISF